LFDVHDTDSWYGEAFAYALERNWMKSKGEPIDDVRELYHKHHYAELLGELLKRNPEEFKKLMSNPSYAIDSKYGVGERVINSIGEQLGMEVPHVGFFDIGRYQMKKKGLV